MHNASRRGDSRAALSQGSMQRILPAGVIAVEHWGFGSEQDLLPEEACYVEKAVSKRRLEFAAGRRCARLALAQLGVPPGPIPAGTDRAPRWPSTVVGSITHSGEYCAAAVGWTAQFRGIGIDAEQLGALDPSLWPVVCSAKEHTWLLSRPAAQRPELATKFFCAKEAFYKCQYAVTGRWLDFQEVDVTVAAGAFAAATSAARGGFSATGAFWISNGVVLAALAMPAGPVGTWPDRSTAGPMR
jgi:enterobactin synthetase component D